MRKTNKFKHFSALGIPLRRFPNKLSKFYRSKWQNLKLKIRDLNREKKRFIDPLITKLSTRFIYRLNKDYYSKLETKKSLSCLFDKNIRNQRKNLLIEKKELISEYLLHPFYHVDILLWYLNLFPSVYKIRQLLHSGYLKVNDKSVKPNYFLKKGDVISIDSKLEGQYNIDILNRLYFENILFLTFIEIDFYTKTITIVKDCEELSLDDYKLLIDQYINIYKLI